MITINGHKLNPTIFPDRTSQVWKLPEWLFQHSSYWIDWRWENESEIVQLAQLTYLLYTRNPAGSKEMVLYVPYLPYARQDKKVGNSETFALNPMGALINQLAFNKVITLDVHNEEAAHNAIARLQNIPPVLFHRWLLERDEFDAVVFPDMGAYNRYPHLHSFKRKVIFEKKRDPSTGQIIGHNFLHGEYPPTPGCSLLVVDDICDGGATFLSVAQEIHHTLPDCSLTLGVTHGLFSKGIKVLSEQFTRIFCTNSLPGSLGEFEV